METTPGSLITLRDVASSPTTEVSLLVDEDSETGLKRWKETRVPLLSPRFGQGALDWTHNDPLVDFVWSQDDWSAGAFQAYWDENLKGYATSQGADLRWKGVAVAGPRFDDAYSGDLYTDRTAHWLDFVINNAGFENATGLAAGGGVTLVTEGSPVYGELSEQSLEITTDGSRSAGDVLASQAIHQATLSPIGAWQSKAITVGVALQRNIGTESGVILRISDGVGTTDTSTVTASSFSQVTATRTIDGSATGVTLQIIQSANETVAHRYNVDSMFLTFSADIVPVGVAELAGALYGAFGRAICKWDEFSDLWRVVHIAAQAATDIIAFNSNVYVAYGTGASYVYGSSTTWTVSNRVAPDDKAVYWATGRSASGAFSLWKSEGVNSVANTIDGVNGAPSWSVPLKVGTIDHNITKLFGAFDSIIVGKEDGLWSYIRFDSNNTAGDNLFAPITASFVNSPSTDNFAGGAEWWGWLYMSTSQQGLVRWRPGQYQDLTSLVFSPRANTLGGRVRGFAASPSQLWLLIDVETDDATEGKTTKIGSLSQDSSGNPVIHLLSDIVLSDPRGLAVHNGFLWALGRHYFADLADYVVAGSRWRLPALSRAPYKDSPKTNLLQLGTSFDSSIWHGNTPDTPKAFLSLTCIGEDITSTYNIDVTYGLDGAASTTTTLGSFAGTERVQTLFFNTVTNPETNAIGRTIQLRFAFDRGDAGNEPPKMYAFSLHSTLRPERLRSWEVYVRVGQEMELDTGYKQPESKAAILSALNTLETQTYPIIFEHNLEEPETLTTITAHLVHRERVEIDGTVEVHRIILQEASTSA
jgi:hypothetical protein